VQQAKDGQSGLDVHGACGTNVTKIGNRTFGQYPAVEYIYDGTNPPANCGRDLIGYEHTVLIRKSDSVFIKLVNGSMDPNKTRAHDAIFNSILSTFKFTDQTPTVTLDWKTFTLPNEKLSIQYPSDWKLQKTDSTLPTYQLTSPNKFYLTFMTEIDGIGGDCDSQCQSHNIPNVNLGKLDFYTRPLYVVVNGFKDKFAGEAVIGFNVITEKTCWANICYGFAGKNSPGTVSVYGSFGSLIPTDQFVNSPDVKTALLILGKLTY
jgi:hypothetical protein